MGPNSPLLSLKPGPKGRLHFPSAAPQTRKYQGRSLLPTPHQKKKMGLRSRKQALFLSAMSSNWEVPRAGFSSSTITLNYVLRTGSLSLLLHPQSRRSWDKLCLPSSHCLQLDPKKQSPVCFLLYFPDLGASKHPT